MNEIEIFFNGVPSRTQAPDLRALLLERGYALEGAYACALNNAFVPRPQWPHRQINPGDRIELIAPIAGG